MNAYRKIPNINILPKENIRAPLSPLQICLILIIVVAAVFGYMEYQKRSNSLDEIAQLDQELSDYTITTEITQKVAQAEALTNEIAALTEDLSSLQGAYGEIQDKQIDWAELFSTLLSTSAPTLNDIKQSDMKITITGTASGNPQLQQYYNDLMDLSSVVEVDITTINPDHSFTMEITVAG